MNRFKCELLSSIWLSNERLLAELSYWLHVMRRPQGWHYDMDEVWALQSLEAASLPVGATVLDAGAGLGIMQYVLAARGYNVVSLDFGKRFVPKESLNIFTIALKDQDKFQYSHPYQKHMSFLPRTRPLSELVPKILSRRLFYRLWREISHLYFHRQESLRPHDLYGEITFVCAAFHDIPYSDNFFDAVVSISALEHADMKLLKENLFEMARVAKRNAPVLVTTSATDKKQDIFDKKTQGWCFSSETIEAFASNAAEEYRKYQDVEQSILASACWRSRLDPYYHLDPSSGFYNKRMNKLPYLPLALSLEK